MSNKLILIFLLICKSTVVLADADQYVLEAFENKAEFEADLKNVDEDEESNGFIPGSAKPVDLTKNEDDENNVNAFFPQKTHSVSEPRDRDRALDRGQRVSDDSSIPRDRLIEANDRELIKNVGRTQSSSFSFYYVRDDFDVSDNRGIYDRTYVNNTGAMRGGTLMISWEQYLINSWVNLGWGLNMGVGLSQGTGRFVDGEKSDAKFSLWSLPLELGLSLEIPVSNWFDLYAEAGPGVFGLMQNRSDFESGAEGKRRRQIGYGYYAEAKFKISLSNIFTGTGFDLFSEYGVSNATLDLIARLQDYGNFQDDITITGQSFGLGLTFDYL